MFDTIKTYMEKKAKGLMTMVKSDDGTLVFFEKQFSIDMDQTPPQAVEKSPEVVKTSTKQEILDEIADYQSKIDTLNQFLTDENL